MTSWTKIELDDVCKNITVGFVGTMADEYVDEGVLFLRSQNILPYKLNLEPKQIKFISEEFNSKIKKSQLFAGDIAIVRTGYPGTACVIPENFGVVNCSDLVIVRPDHSKADSHFLCYYINSPVGKGAIFGSLVGAAQQHFNVGVAKKMKLNLPPLEVQKTIASILSSYDELIENNNQRIKLLEEMADEIYKEWFVRFRFPGYEKTKFIDGLPVGWEKLQVIEIIERYPAGKKYDNNTALEKGNVPILDQGQIGLIGYHNDEPSVFANLDDPIIVFANHTCYQKLIQFNFSAIQNVLPFKSNLQYNRNIHWLHYATKNLIQFNDYKGHWPEFSSKKTIVPDLETAKSFGLIVKPIVNEIYILEQKNEILKQTRDLLLPRLISGKLSVEHLVEETLIAEN